MGILNNIQEEPQKKDLATLYAQEVVTQCNRLLLFAGLITLGAVINVFFGMTGGLPSSSMYLDFGFVGLSVYVGKLSLDRRQYLLAKYQVPNPMALA